MAQPDLIHRNQHWCIWSRDLDLAREHRHSIVDHFAKVGFLAVETQLSRLKARNRKHIFHDLICVFGTFADARECI